jgi:LytS/YehU family sensor histidine kinase
MPDGRFINAAAPLRFTVKPAFWQRPVFSILALLLFALLVFAFFRRRVAVVKRKGDINRQMAELEARAIRAQMNPHFIFNSLNAIQELVVMEATDAAYQYLSKFSRLLRMVLHHSEQPMITLRDEIAMNRLYLELESLRFRASFQFSIDIADSIDEDTTMIPSFLLQPFIENAIWHGLLRKEGAKELLISFTEEEGNLVCRIVDNGIGREAAAAAKAARISGELFSSKGIQLSEERLKWLTKLRGWSADISVRDLVDAEGAAAGTEVLLTLQPIDAAA